MSALVGRMGSDIDEVSDHFGSTLYSSVLRTVIERSETDRIHRSSRHSKRNLFLSRCQISGQSICTSAEPDHMMRICHQTRSDAVTLYLYKPSCRRELGTSHGQEHFASNSTVDAAYKDKLNAWIRDSLRLPCVIEMMLCKAHHILLNHQNLLVPSKIFYEGFVHR